MKSVALRLAFWVLAVLAAALLSQAGVPEDARSSHEYAEAVLFSRFRAAMNDWTYQHPQDRPGKEGEHYRKIDAGDVRRWLEVRAAWRELDEAMKRAGYDGSRREIQMARQPHEYEMMPDYLPPR